MIVARKIAVLAIVVLAIGLPINDLFDYAIVVAAAVAVLVGAAKSLPRLWLAAAGLAALVAAAHILLPAPRIEEGHNVFLPGPDAARTSRLPREVYEFLDKEFAAQYPPEKLCDDRSRGCWRPAHTAAQDGFAFSSDAVFDRGDWSRRVTGISFSDLVYARLGVVNDLIYNWSPPESDIERFQRDRHSLALFHRFHMTFPLYLMYRFPAAFAGSMLCWRGDVLWEGGGEHFEVLRHPDMACREIAPADAGRRIVAAAIRLDHPLAMRLDPSWSVWLRGAFSRALTLLGVIGILGLLVRVPPRKLVWPAVVIGLSLLVMVIDDLNFIGGLRPLDAGDDGMTYEGYARIMLRALLSGDIREMLRGDESVYYFTPGFRYFSMLGHIVFGETYLGYLSLVLALPFLVYALFRRFLPEIWATVVTLGFVATPVGALFGSAFLYYVKWAARGFADSSGYILLLAGMVALIPRRDETKAPPVAAAFCGALLLSAATFVRPNVALAAGVMIAGAILFSLWQGRLARAGAIFVGFATIIVSPLHNWVFGHSTVLFSDNVSQPQTLVMPPSEYFKAASDVLHLHLASDHVIAAIKKLAWWLSGPGNVYATIPLNAAAVAILVRVGFFGGRFDPWLRLIALATLLEHGTGICYADWDRYHLVTWLLTALVATVWLNEEGLPWFGRGFPGVRERLATRVSFKKRAVAAAPPP